MPGVAQRVRRAVDREAHEVAGADRDLGLADHRRALALEDVDELLVQQVGVEDEALLARRHPRQRHDHPAHPGPFGQALQVDLGVRVERVADADRLGRVEVAGADEMLGRVGHVRLLR